MTTIGGGNLDAKDSLYKIATGQISEPLLELEVDGNIQVFRGRDAKVFAFGMLAGMKAEREGCATNLDIKSEH